MPKLIKAYKTDFTIIDNSIFKNKRLCCKDIGLLCLMYSLSDDWDFSIVGLSSICKDGTSSIRSGIENLEKYGYLTRKQSRDQRGSFDGYDYYLYMDPKDNPDYPPRGSLPMSENPTTVNPTLENGPQENKQKERKKKENYSSFNNNTFFIDTKDSTAAAEKHDSSVDDKKTGKGFNTKRIIDSNEIEIARLDEATRNNVLSGKIVDYLSDSCNCFGLDQIDIINRLPDEDFKKLFSITCDIVTEFPDMEKINNPKAFLSSQIKKCIVAYQNTERTN